MKNCKDCVSCVPYYMGIFRGEKEFDKCVSSDIKLNAAILGIYDIVGDLEKQNGYRYCDVERDCGTICGKGGNMFVRATKRQKILAHIKSILDPKNIFFGAIILVLFGVLFLLVFSLFL